MLRLFSISNGAIGEMGLPPTSVSNIQQANWIDAHDPTQDERELLELVLRDELPESDDVEEIEASARCFVDQVGIHVHALFLSPGDGKHRTVTVACILRRNCLITIREGDVADFRLLRFRARRGQVLCNTPADLLVTLMEQKVENHADLLEDIHRQLEDISYLVLEEEDSDLEGGISRMARLEDSNGKIRLCLMDTQRNISFLLRNLRQDPEQSETLREINRDVDTLMSHSTFLFEKINFLMDSTQGFINIKQNQIIKIFSIAAVVFLPPTLVASIYGMNFQHIPELQWLLGYPWALGLMVASAFAPYWYFKRKGWL